MSDDIFEKYQKLKDTYPEDIHRIEQEEERVAALLRTKEYFLNPETQRLIALCRKDILTARSFLATDRKLTDERRNELWLIIDSREWFLNMVSQDVDAELARLDQELEAELTP
jgi:hypothetical protein